MLEDNSIIVSIIIPVYNTEKYLEQCVDSAINQTYKDIYIFLVDDGSTDSSPEICESYAKKDSRITVIHKENGGQSSARNAGIDAADGKYLYFLDSDDYISENAIEELVKIAEKDNADVVFFEADSYMDFDSDFFSTSLGDKSHLKRKHLYKTVNGREQLEKLEKNGEYYVCTPLHFYRKAYLTDNNIRFTEGIIHEDELFSSEIYIHNGLVAHCNMSLYQRRLRPNSTMTEISESSRIFRFKSFTVIYYRQYDLIKKLEDSDPSKRIIALRCTQTVFNLYNALSSDNQMKYRKSYKKIMRHALIHYGKYDFQTAKMCCGPIGKFFLRLFHFLKTKLH